MAATTNRCGRARRQWRSSKAVGVGESRKADGLGDCEVTAELTWSKRARRVRYRVDSTQIIHDGPENAPSRGGSTRVRMEAGQNGLRDGAEGDRGNQPAAARKWNAPFPVSPCGGKPGRAGSPHAGQHASRQQKALAGIVRRLPPQEGCRPLVNPLRASYAGLGNVRDSRGGPEEPQVRVCLTGRGLLMEAVTKGSAHGPAAHPK